METQLDTQKEVVFNIDDCLKNERKELNRNSYFRNKNYDKMKISVKQLESIGIIFVVSFLMLPMLNINTFIYSFVDFVRTFSLLFCIKPLINYIDNAKSFKKNNRKVLENSEMIEILTKKLEEMEKESTNETNLKLDVITRLNQLKKFIELAREYSNNCDAYQSLFHNDLENKYFVSETEDAMTIQGFILDDLKRQQEFQKELILKKS